MHALVIALVFRLGLLLYRCSWRRVVSVDKNQVVLIALVYSMLVYR